MAFNIKFDTITLRIKCKYACNLEMGKTLINSDGLGCVPPGRCVAFMSSIDFLGFPGGSAVINLPAVLELWVPSLSGEDALEKEMQPTPLFLPGKPMDRGAWCATVHGFTKSQTQLSDETTTTVLSKLSVFYCSKL